MISTDPRLVAIRDSFVGRVLRGSGAVSYHIRECIGEGGQGWVYTANWDEPDGLLVIVKVLRPDAVHGEALARFQREADTLRMLSQQARPNPHIVRFFDHAVVPLPVPIGGEQVALPFTVLEYVHGPTLENLLARTPGRGLAVERVRRFTRQVALALDAVHQQKVVHRDLKPSNILLANDAGNEIAKVTDFGLVKLVDMNLHRTAALAGASLGYAPPEQYEQGNKRVSPRTDVFSLGAIVFEMLTGRPAFPYREGENPLLIVKRILVDPRPQIASFKDGLPPELANHTEAIAYLDRQLSRAMAADPAARFEGVKEFFSHLEPYLREANDGSRRPTSPGPTSAVSPFLATEPAFGHSSRNPQVSKPPGRSGTIPVTTPNPAAAQAQSGPPYPSNAPSYSPVPTAPMKSVPPPAPARPSEKMRAVTDPAANPIAWSWAIITRALAPGMIRAAAFSPSGDAIAATGPSGAARWERGAWTGAVHPLPADAARVRTIRWHGRDTFMAGERGFVLRVPGVGQPELLRIPDPEITFLGSHVDDAGVLTLVGERPVRPHQPRLQPGETIGVIAQLSGGRLLLIADAPMSLRLRAATRTAGGMLLACGDWGSLVRLEMGLAVNIGAICGGHLHGIMALPDGGAVTVGLGGHALYISPRLEAQLESVQTTRDLFSLTVGDDGAAWAGAAQARIVRRSASGWLKMGEFGTSADVVSVWATSHLVRAVCSDGSVLEGRLS